MLRKSTAKYVLFHSYSIFFPCLVAVVVFCISNLIFLYLLCSTKHWTLFLHKKHFLGYISKYRPLQVATHILHIKKHIHSPLKSLSYHTISRPKINFNMLSHQQTTNVFFLLIFLRNFLQIHC